MATIVSPSAMVGIIFAYSKPRSFFLAVISISAMRFIEAAAFALNSSWATMASFRAIVIASSSEARRPSFWMSAEELRVSLVLNEMGMKGFSLAFPFSSISSLSK